MKKKLILFLIFSFIFTGLIFRNYLLRFNSFLDWDEGMYAEIAQEMIKNKTLITTFNNQLWFDKPPLSHALIAVSFLLFGTSEFGARTTMVILALFLLILTYLLTQKINSDLFPKTTKIERVVASLIPVLVLSASPIFLERATMLNSDFLVAISWIGYFLFLENYPLKLLFLCLGVFGKSILGFYPLFFDFFLLFFKKSKVRSKKIFGILLAVLISSFWYIFSYLKFGWFFVENHFFSQMFKRLYVPIELHFGNKFYYFQYLWQALGFINILFLLGYFLIFLELFKNFKKIEKLIVFFVPLPFLALLTLMKTKISWYIIIFLPFICITLSYLYLRIKNKFVRIFFLSGIVVFFLTNFIPQTFLLKINNQPSEKIILAKCLTKRQEKNLGFLVDEQERKNRNFLEAAHYQTTSSFFYGGAPSFVFYLNKPVYFFYGFGDFQKNYKNFDMITLSKKDFEILKLDIPKNKFICPVENWITFLN